MGAYRGVCHPFACTRHSHRYGEICTTSTEGVLYMSQSGKVDAARGVLVNQLACCPLL